MIIVVSQDPGHLPSTSVRILKQHVFFVLQNDLIVIVIDLTSAALTSGDS